MSKKCTRDSGLSARCPQKYGQVKTFKEPGARDKHVKEVHLGQTRKFKEAKCPECGEVFRTQKMQEHRDLRHLDNKYYCEVEGCDFFANTKPKLSYHKRGCGKVIFACATPSCESSFKSKKNLQDHYKSSKNDCKAPEVIVPAVDLVPKESARIAQKRKYRAGNSAMNFLYSVSHQLKNFITDSMPTKDGQRRCYYQNCTLVRLAYGVPGGGKISCEEHKESHHVRLSDLQLCVYKGCTTKGTITISGCSGHNLCWSHAKSLISQGLPEEFVTFNKGPTCSVEGCETGASFDKGRFCMRHSPTKVSDETRMCEHEGCTTMRPAFGYPRDTPTRCREHKEEGMFSHKLCDHDGCFTSVSYGPRDGVSQRCSQHKKEGDVVESKCAMSCCMYGEGTQGKFFHPDHEKQDSEFFGKKICSFARWGLIHVALMDNKTEEFEFLKRHFGVKGVVALNAQSVFRIECEKDYYDLLNDCVQVVFDESVSGEAKSLGNRRPDIFYKWIINDQGFAIHLEYDEKSSHEKAPERLEKIAKESGCEGRVYVIRVRGGHDTTNPVCKDVYETYYKYSAVTQSGKGVCREVAELVKERIGWIKEGLPPNSARPAKYSV